MAVSKTPDTFFVTKRKTPGKIIAVMNHKGGAGKSTSIELLGEYQAKRTGESPLFVDFDSQMNLTSTFRFWGDDMGDEYQGSVGRALADWPRNENRDPTRYLSGNLYGLKVQSFGPRLYLMPGSATLGHDVGGAAKRHKNNDLVLRSMLAPLRSYYPYIYLDTSPAVKGVEGEAAMLAADAVIIPLSGLRSVLGMIEVMRALKLNARRRVVLDLPPLQILFYSPHVLDGDVAWHRQVRALSPSHFVTHKVGHSKTISRSYATSLGYSSVGGRFHKDYVNMSEEIHAKLDDPHLPLLGRKLETIDLDPLERFLRAHLNKAEKSVQVRPVLLQGGT